MDAFRLDTGFAQCPTAHRNSGFVHSVRRARDEGMPPLQTTALFDAPIAAARWQPIEGANFLRVDGNAIGNLDVPVGIIAAPARADIKQTAGQPCQVNFVSIFVLQLDQTTAATTVAEAFPLGAGHFLQRFVFPKRNIAILCAVSHSVRPRITAVVRCKLALAFCLRDSYQCA